MSNWNKGNLTMYKNATPHLMHRAANLRENETETEKIFWQLVKDNKIGGYKFRRQHALAHYVVDFYCHKLQLVVELDGGIHDDLEVMKNDLKRQKEIEMMGMKVIRFKNQEVLENSQLVIEQLLKIATKKEVAK